MELSPFFKSVLEQDRAPIVICDCTHTIIYMNPAAAKAEEKHGGFSLVGKSIMDCHNERSHQAILRVFDWFREEVSHNIVHTFHNPTVNKDVYIVALRDDSGELIGYYEKHEFRDRETMPRYALDR